MPGQFRATHQEEARRQRSGLLEADEDRKRQLLEPHISIQENRKANAERVAHEKAEDRLLHGYRKMEHESVRLSKEGIQHMGWRRQQERRRAKDDHYESPDHQEREDGADLGPDASPRLRRRSQPTRQ